MANACLPTTECSRVRLDMKFGLESGRKAIVVFVTLGLEHKTTQTATSKCDAGSLCERVTGFSTR